MEREGNPGRRMGEKGARRRKHQAPLPLREEGGAEVLGASGTPVGRAAGWVALGGAAAQGVALAGQVASPRSLAPHALLSLFPEAPTRGAWWARLGMVGWGTSMVAGTIQHRRNVRAAGPRAEEEPTTHRIELRLVPTGRGVQVAGRF